MGIGLVLPGSLTVKEFETLDDELIAERHPEFTIEDVWRYRVAIKRHKLFRLPVTTRPSEFAKFYGIHNKRRLVVDRNTGLVLEDPFDVTGDDSDKNPEVSLERSPANDSDTAV